eukprot:Amastigsp_a341745_8.p4 type:complete len:107 gc:universal Amastigsp_a341745_8:396-716(+)
MRFLRGRDTTARPLQGRTRAPAQGALTQGPRPTIPSQSTRRRAQPRRTTARPHGYKPTARAPPTSQEQEHAARQNSSRPRAERRAALHDAVPARPRLRRPRREAQA